MAWEVPFENFGGPRIFLKISQYVVVVEIQVNVVLLYLRGPISYKKSSENVKTSSDGKS